MKNKSLKILLSLLSFPLLGCADSAPTQEPESPFIQYHNRVALFAPLHQSYERIKPHSVYFGVEEYALPVFNGRRLATLFDAEFRAGYNFFFRGKDHLTAFGGVGFNELWKRHDRHIPGILYGTVGFLYNHEFNTVFGLGANAKFLMGGPMSSSDDFSWGAGSPVVGCDISLPITFRFGPKRHWDYRIEPFNIFLAGSEDSQNYFGFRGTLGYRF